MLVPLVNFSSSFRFRVRQSCAAVSLRLSQSKPAWTRLSAWRRHSCRTAATGPLAPRFGARSAAAAAAAVAAAAAATAAAATAAAGMLSC